MKKNPMVVQAEFISAAMEARSDADEEKDFVRSIIGIERNEVAVCVLVAGLRRDVRYSWALRAAERESSSSVVDGGRRVSTVILGPVFFGLGFEGER